jgi:hypothetical protein
LYRRTAAAAGAAAAVAAAARAPHQSGAARGMAETETGGPRVRTLAVAASELQVFYAEFLESPWAAGARLVTPQQALGEGVDGAHVVLMEHGDQLPLEALAGAASVTLFNTEHETRPSVRQRVLRQMGALQAALGPHRARLADFSLANLRGWTRALPHGAATCWLPVVPPPQRVAALRALAAASPKLYDVGFVGHVTHRRYRVLHAVAARGLTVLRVDGWGAQRDAALAQCRVLLNVHQTEWHAVHEAPRCAAWVAAGLPLATEAGLRLDATEDDPRCSETVAVAPYNLLADAAVALACAHGATRQSKGSLMLVTSDASKFAGDEVPGYSAPDGTALRP